MLFQSANGGILVLVEEEPGRATELPIGQETTDSETEISASLLSSPILNRGENSTSDSSDNSHNDYASLVIREYATPNHSYFSSKHQLKESRPFGINIHAGSIAALGP